METKTKNPQSRGSRGEKTMEQMLAAGIEAFAKFGPEGVTTRHLAKAAGVNSAAIQYYFGGKEGYYLAVVRYLMKKLAKPFLTVLDETSDRFDRAKPNPEDAGIFLSLLLQNIVKRILLTPEARFFAGISTRENLNPTAAYEIIYDTISKLHGMLANLVGCALGIPADSSDAVIRAHAILGQVLIFRIGATTLYRRLDLQEIDHAQAERIATIVADMACRSIGVETSKDPIERSQ
ncbi:MAG: CerR family C-terminal domain-containing protein [Deltaproteobacteria bacterium]|nr:CerR family C-terminal domain-containing protein [Deltaproteobacteria bacterium]